MNIRKIMAVTTIAQVFIGVIAFYLLGSHQAIEKYKLLNAVGLLLNILGVLLLSKLVVDASMKFKGLFDYLYAFVWAGVYNIPIGIIIGGSTLFWLDLASAATVVSFAAGIIAYVALPLFITDYAGEIFRMGFYKSVSRRVVFMGWYLLFAGMALQLTGAILDLTG